MKPSDSSTCSFNWEDLKYLLALHRCKRLAHAAASLGTSRATVTNRISQLENCFGSKLFNHTISGFELTPAGMSIQKIAEEVEMSLSTSRISDALQRSETPEIKIGVNEGISDHFISRILTDYAKETSFHIKLITLSKNTNVTTKEVDISITIQKPKNSGVVTRKLTDYSLGIYASKDIVSHHGETYNKSELAKLPWVGYVEEMVYSEALMYHRELPDEINFVFQSTSLVAQANAASAGLGFCILPCYIGDNSFNLKRVMPDITFSREYWISTRPDIISSKKHKQIWSYIIEKTWENREFFSPNPVNNIV